MIHFLFNLNGVGLVPPFFYLLKTTTMGATKDTFTHDRFHDYGGYDGMDDSYFLQQNLDDKRL